jgi:hypothetical protein
MAAFVNPGVGVGIAVKALLPGIGAILNKYGLRPVGEKLTEAGLKKRVASAEAHVVAQFEDSSAVKVLNPILQELDLALQTNEAEHDPLTDFDLSGRDLPEMAGVRWRELTTTALYHTYKELIEDPNMHGKAGLGPEGIRWLNTMFVGKQH